MSLLDWLRGNMSFPHDVPNMTVLSVQPFMHFKHLRTPSVFLLLAAALVPLEADKSTSSKPPAAKTAAVSAPATGAALDKQFNQTVLPFVTKYCVACHSGNSPAAQFDIRAYTTMDSVVRDHPRWAQVMDRLNAKEMPPKQMPQPPAEARQQVVDWIKAMRAEEARRNAGDPGIVLARRLSNSEYNYTIRDLTGVDIQPAREFPVDPANQAGFDNSGESLAMSPALMKKYLQAAREVGDHMVLTPDGFNFSPWPALVETDREKYAIERILSFYKSQPTDYAAYFEAAWRYKHRAALGHPRATLASTAAEVNVSPKYLNTIWALIEEPAPAQREVGPVAKLQAMWHALPAPKTAADPAPTKQTAEMRDFVVKIRTHTAMQFTAPVVRGLPGQSQPLLMWKLREYAAHRRESDPADLLNDTDPVPAVPAIPRYPGLHQEAAPRWAALSAKARAGDKDLIVPAADRKRYETSFSRLASVFPDTFYVTERGRYFPDDSDDKGRLLSAGFHSVVGYMRDDTPLMELVLDEKGQKDLDRLWLEFDYIANFTARTWEQFLFNQAGEAYGKGSESSVDRPANHAISDTQFIMGLRDQYLSRAAADPKAGPVAQEAILDHFHRINATLRALEETRAEAEPKHLDALLKFAARAYRRPLTAAEHDDLLAFYKTLRERDSLSHEDAIRDCIVSILMSPDFCYRFDLLETGAPRTSGGIQTVAMKSGAAAQPLTDYALASRLSYFIWSSMPDKELLAHAAAGDLHRPEVLLAQTHRMLKDERSTGLATEFAGNWLDFRRFETLNSVDRDRFPTFNNDLREAMFQEPIRFIGDVIRNDRSVLDMIYGNYTFVNPVLAKHYGIEGVTGKPDEWVRIDDAGRYQRGGLLPMSVFLTQNSPGLRTSPVKRGNWVVKRVLGEIIPPPPPVVPELPHDEAKMDLPLRDMLARHRENPLCAACHARFDTFGLALEGYGPVGEWRTKDLANRPVDASATFPGGIQGTGYLGIEAYIKDHRQNDYLDNLSRKLLSYALSRSLQLSDEPVIERTDARLAANGYKFDTLVDTVVTSAQFLNRRSAPEMQEKRASSPHGGADPKGF